MNRHTFFKHYWWAGLLGGLVMAALAFWFGGEHMTTWLGGVLTVTLGFFYFVQQQKVAETKLFFELFSKFNERYDRMNDRLTWLAECEFSARRKDRDLVVDYFNLCAEEYHFYQQGFIHPMVWQSWCRGMLWYLRRHPFKDIWNEEVKSETFYGLTLTEIEKGANLGNR